MRTITREFNVYKYDELSEEIKNIVVSNYIDFWVGTIDFSKLNKNTNLYKAIRKADELRTPWFEAQFIWDYCKKDILKNVRKNEYYENGIIFCE